MRKPLIVIFVVLVVVIAIFSEDQINKHHVVRAVDSSQEVFIPLISKPKSNLIGMYFQGWLGDQSTFDTEVIPMNEWSGGKLSIVGTFMNFNESEFNIVEPLRTIWDNGFVPFVNVQVTTTAYGVASGEKDLEIRNWARAYKNYSDNPAGDNRIAFLAPMQEMNSCQSDGCWTIWGGDPGNYKLAFRRVQTIFKDEGVPASSVRWVFAPNGWSHYKYDHPFEDYYPGDEWVDVVAISAYNFGGCQSNNWESPQVVFNNPNYRHESEGAYLDRMRVMAPGKPIFIAQTGTDGSGTAKNSWLEMAHDYLANYAEVYGVLYFNLSNQCDFRVYAPPAVLYSGYVEGVSNSIYLYRTPREIRDDPHFTTR